MRYLRCVHVELMRIHRLMNPAGKFWHRHRRPRPVQYHADLEYHLNLRHQEEQAKLAASRKKRPHAHNHEAPSSKAATVEPDTPSKPKAEVWVDLPPKMEPSISGQVPSETTRGGSPASVASSASEPPLAQTVKVNGTSHSAPSAPAAPTEQETPVPQSEASNSSKTGTATPASAPSTTRTSKVSPHLSKNKPVGSPISAGRSKVVAGRLGGHARQIPR